MQMDDFDILLKNALSAAAKEDYFSDVPSDDVLDDSVSPSPEFKLKMLKLTNNPVRYARKRSRPIYKKILRTAAMIVLVAAIMLGTAMLHPEARAKIIGVITSWFSDHTEYVFADRSYNEWGNSCELGYVPEWV